MLRIPIMLRKIMPVALGGAMALIFAPSALAEHWLKVTPDDPYSDQGKFHWFDVDNTYQDRTTGYIVTRGSYTEAAAAARGGLTSWFTWAFDCDGQRVFYI